MSEAMLGRSSSLIRDILRSSQFWAESPRWIFLEGWAGVAASSRAESRMASCVFFFGWQTLRGGFFGKQVLGLVPVVLLQTRVSAVLLGLTSTCQRETGRRNSEGGGQHS